VRLAAAVEYDGSDFAGWQRLPGPRTVQGTLEAALEAVGGEVVRVVGAGRTDSGVHAVEQVAHFDTNWDKRGGEEALRRAWNAVLPRDVVVHALGRVSADFHARHSAESREYRYRVFRAADRSPLLRRHTWHVRMHLDVSRMARAAAAMVGTHDFATFGRPTSRQGSTIRRIDRLEVAECGREVRITIEANAFLRHQVRRMTALLVDVGRSALPVEVASELLAGTWTGAPPRRAPAQGLALWKIRYPDNIFES
jgi:tRNA pseudouridine38-40 synthase